MIIKTTISEEENRIFLEALNKSDHGSRSSFLRNIVNEYLTHKNRNRIEKAIKPQNKEDLKEESFPVRINKFLKEEADKRAKSYGLKIAQWIRNLIQFNLTKQPILLKNEVALLRRSIGELVAIGRNLNQIARKLNQDIGASATDLIRKKQIDDLLEVISLNKSEINNLVKNSNSVWEID